MCKSDGENKTFCKQKQMEEASAVAAYLRQKNSSSSSSSSSSKRKKEGSSDEDETVVVDKKGELSAKIIRSRERLFSIEAELKRSLLLLLLLSFLL